MKQLLLSVPTIIDNETRISWSTLKIGFIVLSIGGLVFFILEIN